MNWAKVYPAGIAVACLLVIIANTPPILTDNLVTAIAQIRQNTAKTAVSPAPSSNTEVPYPEETQVVKKAATKS